MVKTELFEQQRQVVLEQLQLVPIDSLQQEMSVLIIFMQLMNLAIHRELLVAQDQLEYSITLKLTKVIPVPLETFSQLPREYLSLEISWQWSYLFKLSNHYLEVSFQHYSNSYGDGGVYEIQLLISMTLIIDYSAGRPLLEPLIPLPSHRLLFQP